MTLLESKPHKKICPNKLSALLLPWNCKNGVGVGIGFVSSTAVHHVSLHLTWWMHLEHMSGLPGFLFLCISQLGPISASPPPPPLSLPVSTLKRLCWMNWVSPSLLLGALTFPYHCLLCLWASQSPQIGSWCLEITLSVWVGCCHWKMSKEEQINTIIPILLRSSKEHFQVVHTYCECSGNNENH